MKKFSTIGKIDLTDDQPKTYAETIDGLFESIVSYKISGENSELAGKIDITLEGKHEFITIVEKLTKIHIMKERTKLLEGFKHKVYKSGNLNWVDNDINAINESIDILINGGKLTSDFDITVDQHSMQVESTKNDGEKITSVGFETPKDEILWGEMKGENLGGFKSDLGIYASIVNLTDTQFENLKTIIDRLGYSVDKSLTKNIDSTCDYSCHLTK